MEKFSAISVSAASVRVSNAPLLVSFRSSRFRPRVVSSIVSQDGDSLRMNLHKQQQQQQREENKLGRLAALFAGSAGFLLAGGLSSAKLAHAQQQEAAATAAATVATTQMSDLSVEEKKDMEAFEQRIKERNLPAAFEALNQLIENNPSQPEFRYVRGNLYEYVGQLEKALEDFEEALKINPLSVPALEGQAIVMKQQGKDIDFIQKIAEDAAAKAAEEEKTEDRIAFRKLVAQIFTLKEELTQAFEVYEELIKDVPNDFRLHLSQGLLCCFLGNADKAEEHFKSFDKYCPADYLGREAMEGVIKRAKSEAYNKAATNLWERFGPAQEQQTEQQN